MHHSTAVRRLRTLAERAERVPGLWEDEAVLTGIYEAVHPSASERRL